MKVQGSCLNKNGNLSLDNATSLTVTLLVSSEDTISSKQFQLVETLSRKVLLKKLLLESKKNSKPKESIELFISCDHERKKRFTFSKTTITKLTLVFLFVFQPHPKLVS